MAEREVEYDGSTSGVEPQPTLSRTSTRMWTRTVWPTSSVGSSRSAHVGAGERVVVAARRRRGKDRLSRRRRRAARQVEIVPHVAAHAQVAVEREPEVLPRRRRHRQRCERHLVGRLLGCGAALDGTPAAQRRQRGAQPTARRRSCTIAQKLASAPPPSRRCTPTSGCARSAAARPGARAAARAPAARRTPAAPRDRRGPTAAASGA